MLRKKNDLAFIIFIATAWFLVFLIKPAYAYLDPGSGSMILQILLGGVAGLVVILKLYWRRFMRLLGIAREKTEDSKNEKTVDDLPGRPQQTGGHGVTDEPEK